MKAKKSWREKLAEDGHKVMTKGKRLLVADHEKALVKDLD